jgi:hypothetical protein
VSYRYTTYQQPARAFSYLAGSRPATARVAVWLVVAVLAAHVPLGLLMRSVPALAIAHALVVLVVSAGLALSGRKPERVAYAAAYITGAEVLWRMLETPIFWEFGKYAVSVISVLAIIRNGLFKGRMLPVLYFVLLLPSVMLALLEEGMKARGPISFNLSGPFAVMACGFFMSQLKLTTRQLQDLLLSLIAPALSIAVIASFGILTNPDITFTGSSNEAASGGWGPNQVSSALGFGAFAAILWLLNDDGSKVLKVVMFGMVVFLAGQSAMTFSRNGLYGAAVGCVAAFFFLARDARVRVKLIVITLLFVVMTNFVLLPKLDDFTGGALTARFEETDPSGRGEIVSIDLDIFIDNPVLGVGPGQAQELREDAYGKAAPAHTEFTRLLAEHGSLGLLALLALCVGVAANVIRARTLKGKALSASMVGWSFLYMLANAMRLVAPAFALGLSFVTLLPEEQPPSSRVTALAPRGAGPSVGGRGGVAPDEQWLRRSDSAAELDASLGGAKTVRHLRLPKYRNPREADGE